LELKLLNEKYSKLQQDVNILKESLINEQINHKQNIKKMTDKIENLEITCTNMAEERDTEKELRMENEKNFKYETIIKDCEINDLRRIE
jgi:hypothetical protein